MNRSALFFGGLIIAIGLFGFAAMRQKDAQPTEQPALIAIATATASQVPSPTLDYIATQSNLVNSYATSAAQVSDLQNQLVNTTGQLNAVSAQATADANLALAAKAESDRVISENNLKMAQEHTRQLEIIATLTPQHEQNEIMAIRARTDEKEADNQARLGWIIPVELALIVIAVVALIIVILKRAPRKVEPAQDDETDEVTETMPAHAIPAYPGGIDARLLEGIVSANQLYQLAVGIRQGVPFTHDNWTPAEKLMSEGRFTSLQYLLIKYGGATWIDPEKHNEGIELTQKGYQLFNDIYNAGKTTSPLTQDVSKSPPTRLKTPIDDGFQPIG